MYHSITLGDKNTWDDWHLIPTSRPLVSPPAVKTNQVEIPGGDGVLDLTAALAGRPVYNNRTGSWTFIVENGFMPWSDMYSTIMNYLHGQKMTVILEDDPEFYYEGRLAVNSWKSDAQRSAIVIDYDLYPYKKYLASQENWKWDTFNFLTDTIRNYTKLKVDGTRDVVVVGDTMPTIPVITVTKTGMTVTYEGKTYRLTKGSQRIEDLVITNGEHTMTFAGNGTISIEITGGRL